jgi:hypothetical protein
MQSDHSIAYVSKALGPRTRGLSTYEKEYLAILMAVDHWRSYLQHTPFVIRTDQRSLIHLNEQCLHTFWQQNIFSKLLGLQYSVVYKKGTDNRVADALSRKVTHDASCDALSAASPQWVDLVVDSYQQDPLAKEMITKLSVNSAFVPHFTLSHGLLRYKNRIWVGDDDSLKHKLVEAFHHSPIGGHSGVPIGISNKRLLGGV